MENVQPERLHKKIVEQYFVERCLKCKYNMEYARGQNNKLFICIHPEIMTEEERKGFANVTLPRVLNWNLSTLQMQRQPIPDWCPLEDCEHEEETDDTSETKPTSTPLDEMPLPPEEPSAGDDDDEKEPE